MSGLRCYLTKNKIFFEIFASVFIGLGGVGLGLASLIVSSESKKLTEAQIYPSLFVVSDRPLNEGKRSDELLIVNAGGPARNLEIDFESILTVSTQKDGATKCLWLNGFFDTVNFQSSKNDVVARIQREIPGNYVELKKLDPESLMGISVLYESISITTVISVEYVKTGGTQERRFFSYNYGRKKKSLEITEKEYRNNRSKCQKNHSRIEKIKISDLNKLSS